MLLHILSTEQAGSSETSVLCLCTKPHGIRRLIVAVCPVTSVHCTLFRALYQTTLLAGAWGMNKLVACWSGLRWRSCKTFRVSPYH